MTQQTFLVEIGTEELPPKALRSLAESFAANLTAELDSANLEHGDVSWFAAPRRLALKVSPCALRRPIAKSKNAALPLPRHLMAKASQAKPPKVGHAVVVSPSIRLNAW
jgi:glycyl-tRNA synthetase beta subunit